MVVVSSLSTDLYDHVRASWLSDPRLTPVLQQLQQGTTISPSILGQTNNFERKKSWKWDILEEAVGGHSSLTATTHRLTILFYYFESKYVDLLNVMMCVAK